MKFELDFKGDELTHSGWLKIGDTKLDYEMRFSMEERVNFKKFYRRLPSEKKFRKMIKLILRKNEVEINLIFQEYKYFFLFIDKVADDIND